MVGHALRLYDPFRHGIVRQKRGSLIRNCCVLVLQRAARTYRGRLAGMLSEIRPLDAPELSFLAVDSMVMVSFIAGAAISTTDCGLSNLAPSTIFAQ